MKERPILFTAGMVQAILLGWKTQTRRVIPMKDLEKSTMIYADCTKGLPNRYGEIGDRLWVKESFIVTPPCWADSPNDYNIKDDRGEGRIITYIATAKRGGVNNAKDYHLRVRPSIYMPRWASRITLEIVNIQVKQVRDISKADAYAEGIRPDEIFYGYAIGNPVVDYAELWDSINGKRPGCRWIDNPWVWVIEFKRMETK